MQQQTDDAWMMFCRSDIEFNQWWDNLPDGDGKNDRLFFDPFDSTEE